jgi:hypothetical protein
MRHLSTLTAGAVFDATSTDLAGVAGEGRAAVEGRHVNLDVQGSIESLIDADFLERVPL